MQLKLAEYNKEGKFERFLELGKDFGYCDKFITIIREDKDKPDYGHIDALELDNSKLSKQLVESFYVAYYGFGKQTPYIYLKDEKDPLNRFNGLFDGRTYGGGRFVLFSPEDEIKMQEFWAWQLAYKYAEDNKINCEEGIMSMFMDGAPSIEHPELFEKIKEHLEFFEKIK